VLKRRIPGYNLSQHGQMDHISRLTEDSAMSKLRSEFNREQKPPSMPYGPKETILLDDVPLDEIR
jgi:hypothetical protein